jgi:ESS family glutamate:Na+ symporter
MIDFDDRQTIILAILVLFAGKYLNKHVGFFREFNIPEPVTGGVLASLILGALYYLVDLTINFSLDQRDALLMVFFTCIGLSSKLSTLLEGGKLLLILLALAVTYLFIQNLTGIGVAGLAGGNLNAGVLGGSVSLSGGHGTAIAWAPVFIEDYGIPNAMELGIACATFGLVLGGVIGGPIAKFLIKRHKLKPDSSEAITVGIQDEIVEKINVDSMLMALLIISIAVGLGLHLQLVLEVVGIKIPVFVTCLFGGIVLTNTLPYGFKKIAWPYGTPTLALVSDLSLGLFLAMSLMSLQLWTLVDLAGGILVLLLAQVLVITIFVIFVVYRLLGKNYEAAVMASGYAGLALGATPTAIANMTAVTKKFGAAPKAFIVVPLVGAFFIDISNAVIIQTILNWIN